MTYFTAFERFIASSQTNYHARSRVKKRLSEQHRRALETAREELYTEPARDLSEVVQALRSKMGPEAWAAYEKEVHAEIATVAERNRKSNEARRAVKLSADLLTATGDEPGGK